MHSNLENQKIFLAPMEDVTDYPFRQVLLKIGRPDVFFTEFVSVDGLVSRGRSHVSHRLEFNIDEKPIILQLWGRDPKKFYEASRLTEELGFEGININLGCPVKKVMKNGCGAALIEEYDIVEKIVEELKSIELPISIKTRIGQKSFSRDWIEFLLKLDIHTLFIHGRTAAQIFSGDADWDSIKEIVDMKEKVNANIKVVGNGDVKSLDQATKYLEKYGVDGVMIGREVLKNPWVFQKKEVKKKEMIDTLLFHLDEMENFVQRFPDKGWSSIKKFYYGYLREDEELVSLRNNLFVTNSLEESKNLILDFSSTLRT
jgi:nifR3 family TIM-barrel protein